MEWDEVTKVDELNEYIEEHIGWENVYDELYEDFLYGMIRNRESRQRMKRLLKESESDSIVILP